MRPHLIGTMAGIDRIETRVKGLDERLQGGIPKQHIVIVAGASGSMKSSLTFSMLYNSVLHGDTSGIYVTLEQEGELALTYGEHGHEHRGPEGSQSCGDHRPR